MSLSRFLPTVRAWFAEHLGEPTAAQARAWAAIGRGENVLVAAPTGSGKTLAAFLPSVNGLLARGDTLSDETRVLYVSPLRSLSNDIAKNLNQPLGAWRALDPTLPEVRVLVRSGDTPAAERTAMRKRPPHVFVTTPESLSILLTSFGGRDILRSVRTVIVDEVHAVLGSKRGSHLALALERLEALTTAHTGEPLQRIGLSATQKPIEDVARFLVGEGRKCTTIDEGHLRRLDLAIELPSSALETVCSHEVADEMHARIVELIAEHRSTLVFATTRKGAERMAAGLAKRMGAEHVACHHSSLSKERRLDAEQRLKRGELKALVATASLELGIDIGDLDLVVQVGATRSIATLLQRVGRAGHGVGRVPKGRLFPLTQDELVESAALLRAIRLGKLDRTPQPTAPLDILAQHIVAACVSEEWRTEDLFNLLRRAYPYRNLTREDFDATVALHLGGRSALLHRDGVGDRLLATKRARLPAITSGGAIPDRADYRVVLEPEGTVIGSLDEDFALESSVGDVFQLGNAAWRVVKLEAGTVRVADAGGAPPSLPFWFGEAPSRTEELSEEIAIVRANCLTEGWLEAECGVGEAAARQIRDYVAEALAVLGAIPTRRRLVLERFFDETGGMQLVLHAPFGGRINRALGLALRKRFCRSFGFELQAAANEEAIVLSLGPQHSFPLAEVFDYLHPNAARALLIQAVLPTPLFTTRWRWNATRALLLVRQQGGKRVPPALLRMRADDLLAAAFPAAVACGETLAPGDIEIPDGHPLVDQTIEDCLNEAMDVEGFLEVLRGLQSGTIERVAIDTAVPSAFARGILTARPYAFLDDAPLEERRTQAVQMRRTLDRRTADTLGELDPAAVARVREEAWPDPHDAEEVHEALGWMGFATDAEATRWHEWLKTLHVAGRVVLEGGCWYATEATREPVDVLRGRMEALGPVFADSADARAEDFVELERRGVVLRVRLEQREAWCDRRLLARILAYTLERLRKEIRPISAAEFLRGLAHWQHAAPGSHVEGAAGVLAVVRQLAGREVPAIAWERDILRARVDGYRRDWLDHLTLTGQVSFGRVFGSARGPVRSTPLTLVPRDEIGDWLALAPPPSIEGLEWPAARVLKVLSRGGAMFQEELARVAGLLPSHFEAALCELLARGLVTNDSFAALRWLIAPASKRRTPLAFAGRWSVFRRLPDGDSDPGPSDADRARFFARALLRRYGVVFRKLLERERPLAPWRDLARELRALELSGEVRGGRFVAGFSGEQFALPEALALLRRVRKEPAEAPLSLAPTDPLRLDGVLTPPPPLFPLAAPREPDTR